MLKYFITVFFAIFSLNSYAENSLVCRQIGSYNNKTKDFTEVKEDKAAYLTVKPNQDGTLTMVRLDDKYEYAMVFSLIKVSKNTTPTPGDSLILMVSKSVGKEENVFSRLIGPTTENGKTVSVVDLATESFVKDKRAYEERYLCYPIEKKTKFEL